MKKYLENYCFKSKCKEENIQLVNDYWTNVNETDEVEGRLATDQNTLIRY